MTEAVEKTFDVGDGSLKTLTDPNAPQITVELARLAFGLIEPDALHGYERDEYERVKAGLDQASADHADQTWSAVVQLLDYMPLDDLATALAELPQTQDPLVRDATYLLTWGLWHHRAEFGYREGVDYVPGEVEEDWRPAIDGPDELEAFNALASEVGVEGAEMENPDNWRRYRLHGRVLRSIVGLSIPERDGLKARLASRSLGPAALTAAIDLIGRAYVPERFRNV